MPAPILSAQANQIIAIVPYAVAGKQSAQLSVEANGQRSSSSLTVPVTDANPAIYPSVLNADGSKNSAANPAKKGSYITFFVTGEGISSTLPVDGRIPVTPLQTPLLPITVGLNNRGIAKLYAGAAPGYPGLMQVNAQLDADEPSGMLPLVIQAGTRFSPPLSVYVQ